MSWEGWEDSAVHPDRLAPERDVPRFAQGTFQRQWRHRRGVRPPRPGDPDAAVLWPDTFTNHLEPHVARSAVHVLEDAGFRVAVRRGRCAAG